MVSTRANEEPASEEVRFAVVLNGGVSLAVWMGGVSAEIHEVTQVRHPAARGAPRSVAYRALLDLLQADARVDVIAGTSAGGINGAFLALGQAYQGADLGRMLELWTEHGALDRLLRSPLGGAHPSVLRGNDYFLPQLQRAFEQIMERHLPTAAEDHPVELFLTCTLLQGAPRQFEDCLGQVLWEVEHTGLFSFSRDTSQAGLERPDGRGDDFLDGKRLAAELALAARATASFPGAFEPVFVPIREPRAEGATAGRRDGDLDLRGVANFSKSRFVVDGGVLNNEPIAPALQAIWRLPAERQVRRVLLYVNPDPAPKRAGAADQEECPPALRDVLVGSVTRLTMQQSVHEELKAIQAHNARARDLKDARPNLITALPGSNTVADAAFGIYRKRRAVETATRLARAVACGWERGLPARRATEPADEVLRRRQTLESAMRRALSTARDPGPAGDFGLPWIPAALAAPRQGEPWRWGISPLERLVAFTLDQLKRAQSLANRGGAAAGASRLELRQELLRAREEAHHLLATLRDLRRTEDALWTRWAEGAHDVLDDVAECGRIDGEAFREALDAAIAGLPGEVERAVAGTAARAGPGGPAAPAEARGDRQHIAARAVERLGLVVRVLQAVRMDNAVPEAIPEVGAGEESTWPGDTEWAELHDTMAGLVGGGELTPERFTAARGKIAERLLLAEVYVSLAGLDLPASEQQEVQLALVSGLTRPRWAQRTQAPEEKIAGLKLGHFGAFYKKSWRVNDWLWGRVDGAEQLCRVLLDPERLRQLGVGPERLRAHLQAAGVAAGELQADPELERELQAYPAGGGLERTAAWFAQARHREVITGEMIAELGEACQADLALGTSPYARGAVWAKRDPAAQAVGADPWLRELDEAGVGREDLEAELGTNQLSRTVARLVADVTATLRSAGGTPGMLKAPLQALHGVVLLIYALVMSWTGGPGGAAFTSLALAAGGAMVAVGALAHDPDLAWLGTAGAGLLTAGLAAATLRARLRTVAVLLGPVALVLLFYAVLARSGPPPRIGVVLLILAVVAGAWLLGAITEPHRMPGGPHLLRVAEGLALALAAVGLVALVRVEGKAVELRIPTLRGWLSQAGGEPPGPLPPGKALPPDWSIPHLLSYAGFGLLALALVALGLSLLWSRIARRIPDARGSPELDEVTTVAWLPWYAVAYGLVALAAAGYAARPGAREVPVVAVALLLGAVASWIILSLLWPPLIVARAWWEDRVARAARAAGEAPRPFPGDREAGAPRLRGLRRHLLGGAP